MIDKSDHTNQDGVEIISLLIITEGPKEFAVEQPSGRSGAHFDETTSKPTTIHSNKLTATIEIWGHSDRDISLGSLESCREVLSG